MQRHELESAFLEADTMPAVGMTEMPEIGRVPERLKMLEVPIPRPEAGHVAIKLSASAMHIDEIYAAQGTCLGRFYAPENISEANPYILGSSVSGVVVALGEGAAKFSVGDHVIVIPDETGEFASWARYRCVAEKMVMRKPEGLTHVEAAAVTMASCVSFGAIESSKVEAGARCVVVGASGSIGVMVIQFLKSRGCQVTAVCSASSEEFVRARGADEVIDYGTYEFGDYLRGRGELQDAVFDCVGGRDTEANAFKALVRDGVFGTVVGPRKYIGEEKLSWWEFGKVMAYIGYRMFVTLFRGPRYIFGEKYPRTVIASAMEQVMEHGIRMPVQEVVPFELEPVVAAVKLLTTHRAKGRVVIDFTAPHGERRV